MSLLRTLLNRLQLLRLAQCGNDVIADGRLWVHGSGKVEVGEGTRFEGGSLGIELYTEPDGCIRIGAGVVLREGVSIEACQLVSIGDRVIIDAGVKVLDNSYHALQGSRDERPPSKPVTIEEGTFIGARAIILPGTHLVKSSFVPERTVTRSRYQECDTHQRQAGGPRRNFIPERTLANRAWRRLLSILHTVPARLQLRDCVLGRRVQATGRVLVEGGRRIFVGDDCRFYGGIVPTRLVARTGAVLKIGRRCRFNYGARIEAYQSIEIGDDCMCASSVVLCDCVEGTSPSPIIVEDNVWLAHGAVVSPGVRIGRGAVVSAGSVVVRDVPPETLAVGNPARAIPLRLLTARPRLSNVRDGLNTEMA